jgi:hypothetical protein
MFLAACLVAHIIIHGDCKSLDARARDEDFSERSTVTLNKTIQVLGNKTIQRRFSKGGYRVICAEIMGAFFSAKNFNLRHGSTIKFFVGGITSDRALCVVWQCMGLFT